jgi:hypothetical protein
LSGIPKAPEVEELMKGDPSITVVLDDAVGKTF